MSPVEDKDEQKEGNESDGVRSGKRGRMKDFIETLKKHGYEVATIPGGHWIGRRPGVDGCVTIIDEDGEGPHLAFWCLDEIERLGEGCVHLCRENHDTWAVRFYGGFDSSSYMSGMYGKTRTEACMSALVAVLENK
jgi:hypothetical protein